MADTPTDWQAVAIQQQQRLQTLEAAQDRAIVDAALITAIGSHPVVEHGKTHLVELLRDKVALVSDGAGGKVAMVAGQPVREFVTATLATEGYQHFLHASGRAAGSYAPGAADNLAPPKTMEEGFRRTIKEQLAERGDWKTNPRMAMPTEPKG